VKIDSLASTGTSAPTTENRPRPKPAAQPAAGEAAEVKISEFSSRLQAIEGGAGQDSTVNAARVAEIKQAITDGRFTINTGAIADRLIGSARELLLKQKP
jgi:negative regulator of flagellin synthesis FlgM